MLNSILDSLEGLSDELKGYYVEKNGKFELQVAGMKTQADIDRLQSALVKERNDHKILRDRYAPLSDKKVEDILAQLDRIPELEASASGKPDETKINELVEARIKSKLGPLEREKGTLSQKLTEALKNLEGFQIKERVRTIHDSVREAIQKMEGFQQSAIEDALLYAERMLDVDETGKVVTKEGVGVTPGVEATAWLSDMQAKKSHWWGPSQGGGASGNRLGGPGIGNNPWKPETWNMTEQGRILRENRARAEQLARVAGTSIGGPRPNGVK